MRPADMAFFKDHAGNLSLCPLHYFNSQALRPLHGNQDGSTKGGKANMNTMHPFLSTLGSTSLGC